MNIVLKLTGMRCQVDENYDGEPIFSDDEDFRGAIVDAVASHLWSSGAVNEIVESHVKVAVQEAVNEEGRKLIAPLITQFLEDGWQKTDSYGHPTGSKITARQMVTDLLTRKSDGYNDTWVARTITAFITESVKGEYGKLLTEAKAQIKAMLDAKSAEAFREAVGAALKSLKV